MIVYVQNQCFILVSLVFSYSTGINYYFFYNFSLFVLIDVDLDLFYDHFDLALFYILLLVQKQPIHLGIYFALGFDLAVFFFDMIQYGFVTIDLGLR